MESAPGPKYIRLGIVLAVIVAWTLFVTFGGVKQKGTEAPSLSPPSTPTLADFAWTLRDVDDKPVEFSSYKGKPILLNIFATWCGPCMQEMPSIDALAADPRVKAKGVVVVCVSAGESADTVREFAKQKPHAMTILRATNLPPVFTTDGIPATYLISPDGQVKVAVVGSQKWDDPTVIDFLEKMK